MLKEGRGQGRVGERIRGGGTGGPYRRIWIKRVCVCVCVGGF